MTRVKRIGPLSLAKVMGLVYAGLGLIVGAIMSLVAVLGAAVGFAHRGGGVPMLGVLFGAGAVILLPIFYGLLGFVCGAIGAWIYNLAAGAVGGLELDLE
jgi:hypothetical protein